MLWSKTLGQRIKSDIFYIFNCRSGTVHKISSEYQCFGKESRDTAIPKNHKQQILYNFFQVFFFRFKSLLSIFNVVNLIFKYYSHKVINSISLYKLDNEKRSSDSIISNSIFHLKRSSVPKPPMFREFMLNHHVYNHWNYILTSLYLALSINWIENISNIKPIQCGNNSIIMIIWSINNSINDARIWCLTRK